MKTRELLARNLTTAEFWELREASRDEILRAEQIEINGHRMVKREELLQDSEGQPLWGWSSTFGHGPSVFYGPSMAWELTTRSGHSVDGAHGTLISLVNANKRDNDYLGSTMQACHHGPNKGMYIVLMLEDKLLKVTKHH